MSAGASRARAIMGGRTTLARGFAVDTATPIAAIPIAHFLA